MNERLNSLGRKLLLVASAAIFLIPNAFAQLTTATILGTVSDSTGAVIPGARITATNVDTHFTRAAAANADGTFRLEFLPIGHYELKVDAQGFKSYSQTNITLNLNDQLTNNITLSLGDATETITVTDAPSLVQSSASSLGRVIDNTEVDNLPIVGRNVYDLLTLTAGVQTSSQSNVLGYPQQVVYINGGTDNFVGSVSYYLDGGLNMTSLRNTGNILPNPDALQEFNVQTNNYNALYGRMSAGLVNVVTKSGTNRVHGSIFEFLRNDRLNALPYRQTTKSSYHRNQFGATLGGPIWRDKTFFFGTYGGLRQSTPTSVTAAVVPTAAERAGDFSADLPANLPVNYSCSDASAADVAAGRFIACNPLTKRPFANNKITTLDPTAQNIINKYIPLPNAQNLSTPFLNRWTGYTPAVMNTDEFLIKVDHNLTPNQRVQVSYFNTSGIQQQSPGGNLVWSQQNYSWRQQNANVSHTWTISPTKINQIWLNYTRMLAGRVNTPAVSLGDLGSSFTAQGTPSLPQITVTNYFTLAQSIAGPKAGTNFYSLRDVYSWNRGKHAIAFGGEASLNKDIQQTLLNNYGVFSFNGTRAVAGCLLPNNAACPSAGVTRGQNGLVDFMLGLPVTMGQDTPVTAIDNIWFYGLFLQDDYKIKPNLTLNLGLRWDVQPAPTDPQNRLSAWLPGARSTVITNAPAGLLFPGDSYNNSTLPRGLVNTRYHHVSPRIGFAWDPFGDGRTAVRGAGGLFYGSVSGNEWNANSNFLPFAVRNTYSNVTSLTNVYADKTNFPNGNPYPYVYSPTGARFIYPAALQGIDPAYQWPYTYQFNLSVQQQFTRDFAMTVSYVSTLSHDVPFAPDLNYPIWSPTAKSGDQNSRRPYGATGKTTQTLSTVNIIQSKQKANYHGLQIDVEKRMGHGVSIKSFYVWSRTMSSAQVNNSGAVVNSVQDANQMAQEYGRSDTDIRHRSQTSIIWQPNYFANRGLLTRSLLNGWTVSGIVAFQSGTPFTVLTGSDTNFDGISYDRANVVAGQPFGNSSYNHVDPASKFFNPSAFCVFSAACPGIGPGGSDGNSKRNAYSGPGAKNVNAAIFRNFKVWEGVQLQGRVEATNVFNFANFSFGTGTGPTVNINNANAGTISSNSGNFPMRQLQVGARILF
ncbi:MAG TPA: carboxypeptidase regulatory-like domain-containing protein [Edaphobacter sp.]|nr:carboxypeptidase regulatory-like domain-containing protein [Edaphobacter sp.]